MKALALFLALATVPVFGEDWKTTDGKTYSSVTVVKVDADAVTILDSDGGATVPLTILSVDLQKKFHYDPVKAQSAAAQRAADDKTSADAIAADKQKEAIQKAQEDARRAQDEAAADKSAKAVADSAMTDANLKKETATFMNKMVHISGTILQKLPDGYMVQALGPTPLSGGRAVDFNSSEYKASLPYTSEGVPILADATVFLSSKKDFVDGDAVEANAVLIGEKSYTTVLGAQKTVRQYAEYSGPIIRDKSTASDFHPGSMNPPH